MASSTRMQNYIERLSEELRLQICEFLPISALKNLGLASKRWRKTSSTLLWNTREIILYSHHARFYNLILSLPDGIFDNIKNLGIVAFPESSTAAMQLVSCLARNTLRTVQLRGVDAGALDLLFCSQNSLEKFTFRGDPDMPQLQLPGRLFLAPSLKQLRYLKITSKIQNYGYDYWISNTPALETLSIGSGLDLAFRDEDPVHLNMANLVYRFAPLRLRRLSIASLVLVNGAK
ncbi:hypothetical protein ACET3X_006293 [Alternaria dauci]|uniref:F-box domain-containing protein n=1 Tax=Alternaria dauci TaxID=48095 RepID=A0ABR3UKC7_9PLEO